jgi:O-6-methylguanine DNA methyltransferase
VAESAFAEWYRKRTGRRVVRAIEVDALARAAQTKLRDPDAAEVPLDLGAATDFERAVLANVARIRRGYARPYDLLAHELREPAGTPGIASILADNPVPLLVPCHRVIHAERCCGSEYIFGAPAQRQLLESEGLDPAAIDRVTGRGFRYIGSADGYFCLPTCGDIAKRVDDPGYFGLHSISEAHAHGLHACESCRPIAA